MMELDIALEEHRGEAEAKVYEAAGGYAPTIGIIGAVLGLIQVMKHLANIDEVGRGIAVAFVATVYGVASANIFFFRPAASSGRACTPPSQMRELMLEGVLGIAEGLNPKLIRIKLEAYAPPQAPKKAPKESARPGRRRASPRRLPLGSDRRRLMRAAEKPMNMPTMSAGWSPMRTSSPCSLPFSW